MWLQIQAEIGGADGQEALSQNDCDEFKVRGKFQQIHERHIWL